MRLAFYYHITIYEKDKQYFAPSFFAVFLQALAVEVNELSVIFHQANSSEIKGCDAEITNPNIVWINLGLKASAWERTFFPKKYLANIYQKLGYVDALLVRSPTPFAHNFHRFIDIHKIVFLIVGDLEIGAIQNHQAGFRNRVIQFFLKYVHKQFEKEIARTHVIVNSPSLFDKYKSSAKTIHQIKTTTLSQSDFYPREDTCQETTIKLLYTGRIDMAKGLQELLEATIQLNKKSIKFELHFVGWEYDTNEPVKHKLLELAKENGFEDCVFFHGKLKVGAPLNAMYRMADIYVIPSYHEGFPRTIWEAMANSLPVIASKVGAIPAYLSHDENAILIEPKSVDQIVSAVQNLTSNTTLRQSIIKSAFELVQENTLENQTKKLVHSIKQVTKP